MRRFTALVAALIIAVVACSSTPTEPEATTVAGSSGADATTPTRSVSAETTTIAPAPGTTTTTSVAATGSFETCVIGRWVLDPVEFFEQIADLNDQADGEFVFLDGEFVLNIEADGAFSSSRDNWSFAVISDFGDLQVTVNDADAGTWSLDGDVLTTVLVPGDPPVIDILVDGLPFEFPGGVTPFEPPQVEFTGATVTCDGDTLTAVFDGNASEWMRG